jgi:hypothetical protein
MEELTPSDRPRALIISSIMFDGTAGFGSFPRWTIAATALRSRHYAIAISLDEIYAKVEFLKPAIQNDSGQM